MNPERHRIHQTELSRQLAREFPDRRLFTYFHLRTRKWVIAEWVCDTTGLFTEIMNLGLRPVLSAPDNTLEELRRLLNRPADHRALREFLRAEEYRELLQLQKESTSLREQRTRIVRDAHPGVGASRLSGPVRVSMAGASKEA